MDTLAGRSLPYYIVHKCPNNVNTYTWHFYLSYAGYRKILKVSPSKYKPPNAVMQKTLRQIAPPNISPVACTWSLPSNITKNEAKTVNLLPTMRLTQSILKCKFPFVDKPLRLKAAPKISPSKRAFKKKKAPGLIFGILRYAPWRIPFSFWSLGFLLVEGLAILVHVLCI